MQFTYSNKGTKAIEFFHKLKFSNPPKVTILWKNRGKSQESFKGKSGENVDSNSKDFLVTHSREFLIARSKEFLVTHSEEFLTTLSKEFLVTNFIEFLVANSAEKLEKMSTNLWTFLRISNSNSWEFPGNHSQDFFKSSSGISWLFSAYSWVLSLTRTLTQ